MKSWQARKPTNTVKSDQLTLRSISLPEEGEVELKPIKYDAIKLLTGAYTGKRPYIIVEVKAAEAVILTDENGNDIVYEHQGEEYLAAQMNYTLGKILEKHID